MQVPGGADVDVTKANAQDYVHLYAASRLRHAQTAAQAMRRGMVALVSAGALRCLNAEDLWLLLNGEGAATVDVARLRSLISFRDTRASVPHDKPATLFQSIFWDTMAGLSEEDRARFLYFSTGWSRLPAAASQMAVQGIRVSILDPSDRLPSAHSCFKVRAIQ